MEIEGKNTLPDIETGAEGTDATSKLREAHSSGKVLTKSRSNRKEMFMRTSDSHDSDDVIHSAPDVRQVIVDEIRSEIESGKYNVKAEKIAEKMISDGMLRETK
jgi:flagellar biosynthesis anti-sigma factor FlgM